MLIFEMGLGLKKEGALQASKFISRTINIEAHHAALPQYPD